MQAAEFRSRLVEALAADRALLAPHRYPEDANVETRPAAVVVPIMDYGTHATLLLTLRQPTLAAHAGQVCFPGGMQEAGESLEQTARRECLEELGLDLTGIEMLPCSRPRITGTGFCITPFLAVLPAPLALAPDTTEVAEVFEVPLATVCDGAAYSSHAEPLRGVMRTHDRLPFGNYHIWGATAGILRDLCRTVNTASSFAKSRKSSCA